MDLDASTVVGEDGELASEVLLPDRVQRCVTLYAVRGDGGTRPSTPILPVFEAVRRPAACDLLPATPSGAVSVDLAIDAVELRTGRVLALRGHALDPHQVENLRGVAAWQQFGLDDSLRLDVPKDSSRIVDGRFETQVTLPPRSDWSGSCVIVQLFGGGGMGGGHVRIDYP